MADKDVEIAIVTSGDVRGAVAVQTAIEEVAAKAAATERKLVEVADADLARQKDKIAEIRAEAAKADEERAARADETETEDAGAKEELDLKALAAGGLGAKILLQSTGQKELILKTQAEMAKLGFDITTAAGLDAAVLAGSFAAVAGSAVLAFKGVGNSLSEYKDLIKRWRDLNGEGLDAGAEDVLRYAEVFSSIEQPIDAAIDSIGGLVKGLKDIWESPLEALKDLRKYIDGSGDFEAAIVRVEQAQAALKGIVQERAAAGQVELGKIYGVEYEQLKKQEESLERISAARSALGSLEVQRANLEVTSAKQRGGDVGLAEANVLATELRLDIEKLQRELGQSAAAAKTGQQQAAAAMVAYQVAMRDGLDKEAVAALSAKVDEAAESGAIANEALAVQKRVFEEAKKNLLLGAENSLAALEQEYDGKTTALARQAFDGVYETIKVEAEAVVGATKEKAAEVTKGVEKIQTEVVSQHKGLLESTKTVADGISKATDGLKVGLGTMDQNVSKLVQMVQTLADLAGQQAYKIDQLGYRMTSLGSNR